MYERIKEIDRAFQNKISEMQSRLDAEAASSPAQPTVSQDTLRQVQALLMRDVTPSLSSTQEELAQTKAKLAEANNTIDQKTRKIEEQQRSINSMKQKAVQSTETITQNWKALSDMKTAHEKESSALRQDLESVRADLIALRRTAEQDRATQSDEAQKKLAETQEELAQAKAAHEATQKEAREAEAKANAAIKAQEEQLVTTIDSIKAAEAKLLDQETRTKDAEQRVQGLAATLTELKAQQEAAERERARTEENQLQFAALEKQCTAQYRLLTGLQDQIRALNVRPPRSLEPELPVPQTFRHRTLKKGVWGFDAVQLVKYLTFDAEAPATAALSDSEIIHKLSEISYIFKVRANHADRRDPTVTYMVRLLQTTQLYYALFKGAWKHKARMGAHLINAKLSLAYSERKLALMAGSTPNTFASVMHLDDVSIPLEFTGLSDDEDDTSSDSDSDSDPSDAMQEDTEEAPVSAQASGSPSPPDDEMDEDSSSDTAEDGAVPPSVAVATQNGPLDPTDIPADTWDQLVQHEVTMSDGSLGYKAVNMILWLLDNQSINKTSMASIISRLRKKHVHDPTDFELNFYWLATRTGMVFVLDNMPTSYFTQSGVSRNMAHKRLDVAFQRRIDRLSDTTERGNVSEMHPLRRVRSIASVFTSRPSS